MIDRRELKDLAKNQISGNIGMLFLCLIVMTVIESAVTGTVIGAFIVIPPLQLGWTMLFFGLVRGEKPQLENLFRGFNIFSKSIIVYLLMGVFAFLWSLLLIVPGIIKAISYSFAPYILIENPDIDAMEAINISKQMTNGHKMDLFVLGLSFILWLLLVSITFGIAAIYVKPYMDATFLNAYLKIKSSGYQTFNPEPQQDF